MAFCHSSTNISSAKGVHSSSIKKEYPSIHDLMIRNLPALCRVLIISIVASFVVGLFAQSMLAIGLPLYGPLVIPGMQLWRLITYPFFAPGIFTALGSAVIIYFFGVELETIVHTKRLSIWLAVTVLTVGVVATFLPSHPVLAGPQILYLFLITGFTYLWPERQISIFGMFWLKAWIFSAILFFLAIIPLESRHMDFSLSNLLAPLLSIGMGLLFFHVTYRQYRFGNEFLGRLDPLFGGKSGARKREETWEDKISVEHRIDALLDKISKQGMDSLTQKEREYLFKNTGK